MEIKRFIVFSLLHMRLYLLPPYLLFRAQRFTCATKESNGTDLRKHSKNIFCVTVAPYYDVAPRMVIRSVICHAICMRDLPLYNRLAREKCILLVYLDILIFEFRCAMAMYLIKAKREESHMQFSSNHYFSAHRTKATYQ